MIRNTAINCGTALLCSEQKNLTLELPEEEKQTTNTLYSQIDGSMVPIQSNEDGKVKVEYKECKLGLFFREEDIDYRHTKSNKKNHSIKSKKFVSSIGKGVEDFEQKFVSKAKAFSAQKMVFLSDGAVWIDNLLTRNFPQATLILDWYHAVEHLWDCAKSIFGENNKAQLEEFIKPRKQLLWDGKIESLCSDILSQIKKYPKKETELRDLYSYYDTRKEKMKYNLFREKGYFIGSGCIESANKYLVNQRLKRAGMKWLVTVAEAILKIREKIYEKTWEQVCKNKKLHFSY